MIKGYGPIIRFILTQRSIFPDLIFPHTSIIPTPLLRIRLKCASARTGKSELFVLQKCKTHLSELLVYCQTQGCHLSDVLGNPGQRIFQIEKKTSRKNLLFFHVQKPIIFVALQNELTFHVDHDLIHRQLPLPTRNNSPVSILLSALFMSIISKSF